ncbi:MAG: phytoene desaturase family protein [Bryobacterales bacterium]|nr:phytoene desaturase family protein [Bryobacteraceae bacterium]MDW8130612.1 phytoene desaturase family protein [Bryobacterales bacterium]
MRAVVIGAGLSGLAAALRLRRLGLTVTVCDNGERPGGKMNRWRAADFCLDTGPTLLTMPEVLRRLFHDLGEPLEQHLEIRRLDPHAEYVFPDGSRLAVPASWEEWLKEIASFAPADVQGLRRLHEVGRRIYLVSRETFFRNHPLAASRSPSWSTLRQLPLRYAWGNYARVVARLLRNERLRRVYLRYPTYVGSSPYLTPATLLVIPFLEHHTGVWFVQGGMYRIVESLVGWAGHSGVQLRLGEQVVGIEHERARVRAVRLASGARLQTEVIVYTGDSASLPLLLGEPIRTRPATRSLSGLVVLLGFERKVAELHRHTVFFSEDYREEFEDLFSRRRFPRDPTVYVHAPAESECAPAGGQALYLMANAPADPAACWDEQSVREAVDRIFARLERSGLAGLKQRAAVAEVWHPGRMAARFLAPGGAIYGDNSHGWRRAFLRPPNRARWPRGLYCAGGSYHPGGGIPMVLLSAEIVARLVQQDFQA